jgi:hypothetical protein
MSPGHLKFKKTRTGMGTAPAPVNNTQKQAAEAHAVFPNQRIRKAHIVHWIWIFA